MANKDNLTYSGMDIPECAIESLARCLLPHIQKFYESVEGKQEFAEWQGQREKEMQEDGWKS